ncbi:MAG: branched-chain amino acid aminotransferase [Rikenellaceae bacterium]
MKKIDWENIGFGYMKTDKNIRIEYKNGAWGEMCSTAEEHIPLHMASASLHYGEQCFEGLKAFRGADGKVRLFRPYDNARRMINSAKRLCMPTPTEEIFVEACIRAVKENIDFVPPYGTGASLYIRPLLIGIDAVLGINPPKEAMLITFVAPVGAYFKGGMTTIKVIINTEYDRAAPRGTGAVKCGGNYAASIYAGELAHKSGYASVMYLDAAEHKYIEECGAANFFGIKDGKYITPESPSILPSITNMSLRTLAEDMGLVVEKRPIPVEELSTFDECGACGTAAVISPIARIDDPKNINSAEFGDEVGPYSKAMFEKLQDIQYGRCEDKFNWCVVVE